MLRFIAIAVALCISITVVLAAALTPRALTVHEQTPVSIPVESSFPMAKHKITAIAVTGDTASIKSHVSALLNSMTCDVADDVQIWETWASRDEVFAKQGEAPGDRIASATKISVHLEQREQARRLLDAVSALMTPFAQAEQLLDAMSAILEQREQPGRLSGASLAILEQLERAERVFDAIKAGVSDRDTHDLPASVLYNPEAHAHIIQRQYNTQKGVEALRDAGHTEIVSFPRDAVIVKAVWWPVLHDQLTPMPVWTNQRTFGPEPGQLPNDARRIPASYGKGFFRWRHIVAVDPTPDQVGDNTHCGDVPWNPLEPGRWPTRSTGDPIRTLSVVPITTLHTRTVKHLAKTSRDKQLIDNIYYRLFGKAARDDDYLVLVGMHVITKELDDWVWATIWWSDTPKSPPPTLLEHPVWSNYNLEVTVHVPNMITTASQELPAVFNPWIEAALTRGVQSNCISCHQRARLSDYSEPSPTSVMSPRRKLLANDPRFKNSTLLDYIWSLSEAQQ